MPIWPAEPTESGAYPFNPQETARLSVYRAAVAAGFYTDSYAAPFGPSAVESDRKRRERTRRPAA